MKTPTEKDYDDIRDLGKRLHIPTPEMHWGFKVENLDGETIHEHEERGHSWVRNAYTLLTCQMCNIALDYAATPVYGPGNIIIKKTNGVLVHGYAPAPENKWGIYGPSYPESPGYGYVGVSSSVDNGIVVGTGTTSYDFEQFALSSIILNGSGTGQLAYQASTMLGKSYNSENKTFTVTYQRIFNNNSSGSQTISEVGMYAKLSYPGGFVQSVMMTRDVLSTPVEVPTASKLTVTYTLSVAFPA